MDAAFNHWFLDPILGLGYPSTIVERYGSLMPRVDIDDLTTVATPIDLLGLNLYFPIRVADDPGVEPLGCRVVEPDATVPRTSMGWVIDPEALTEALVDVARQAPGLPLIVTESGAAFTDVPDATGYVDDRDRLAYHASHIAATVAAVAAGALVEGYFAWSLLDNFEWAMGSSQRFGVVRVGPDGSRVPKASARWLRDLARAHRDTS
jgi:beta-glucosidase